MKAKKAIKRLDKVKAILSDVIDQYPTTGSGARELLDAARVSVIAAKAGVKKELEPGRKGVSSKGEQSKRSGAKTRESKPAPKTFSGVKRKGVRTETAHRSSGTQQAESKTA